MLAQAPSVYPDDTLLNLMTLAGAPGAYNKNLGSGAGLGLAIVDQLLFFVAAPCMYALVIPCLRAVAGWRQGCGATR